MNNFISGVINNFTTNKLLVIRDKKLSLSTKVLQIVVFCLLLTDLLIHELYHKTEIPSGYTSMWAESNDLVNYHNTTHIYCDNLDYNYVYQKPDWEYTNISCVDLDYSEMHIKGENEIFFLTHFTENQINITDSDKDIISKRNFFTTGVEGMILAFDHFFSTSFTEGGNVARRKIRTHLRDCGNNYDKYVFQPGETIKLSIKQWMDLACIDLENSNTGTIESLPDPLVKNIDYPKFRLTGIDLLVKISYYNMKSISGYDSEECLIHLMVNEGWSSKGSSITYLNYPNLNTEVYNNHYVDRYKYGIKFKFLVTGLMGTFDFYNVVTHFVSGKVLIDMCALIVITFASTFFVKYAKKFSGERVDKLKNRGKDKLEDISSLGSSHSSCSSPTINSNSPTPSYLSEIDYVEDAEITNIQLNVNEKKGGLVETSI